MPFRETSTYSTSTATSVGSLDHGGWLYLARRFRTLRQSQPNRPAFEQQATYVVGFMTTVHRIHEQKIYKGR